ncbi:calcium-binding protein [Tropicimonas isoalkanivorans]|uniref:Hemolysin-type calcium-binding repeat-containing protein n=1 Tax=Tropicimonas isoalkanivorans TaxID=441112 RepID=A0A1I1IHB1_9RHOB|nr:calcium-binding protein [Tropicimonas isoalkanivorans]SFC35351.1 Hemolysin-type calcium-binding repeat-containing protein [Tropicimonas isoalkanivorans]
MARVRAVDSFLMNGFNLNVVEENATNYFFFNNDNWTYWGKQYQDAFTVRFLENSDFLELSFTGDRIVADKRAMETTDNEMVGGKVTGMFLGYWDSSNNFNKMWAIQNFTLAATDVTDAMSTSGTRDDTALFRDIFSGRDRFDLSSKADYALGFGGNDKMFGNGGGDLLAGGRGADLISGGNGRDLLFGQAGDDILFGGRKADSLIGGKGDDRLTGGQGPDTFLFGDGDGRDVVADFTDDVDTLWLSAELWSGDLTARQVVREFAVVRSDRVVFKFGDGDRLIVRDVDRKVDLIDDIQLSTDSGDDFA